MKRTRKFLPVFLLAGAFAFLMGCSDDDSTNNNNGPPCNNDNVCDADESAVSCQDCVVACNLEQISGDSHDFLVSELFIPDSSTSAKENGVDIDGDGTIDNKLGSIISLIASQGGDFDVNELVNEQITDGDLLLIGRVYVDQWGGDDEVLAQVFQGEVVGGATPIFEGNDTVAIASSSPTDLFLCGRMVNDELQAGPDDLRIVIPIPDIITLDITLTNAQMIGDIDADGMYDVMIGGGIAKSEIEALYADAVDLVNDMIDEDPTGSTATTILDLLDDNCEPTIDGCDPLPAGCAEDQTIHVDELKCNALLNSALSPDVDFDDEDPSNDLISLGLRIVTAVPVTVQ